MSLDPCPRENAPSELGEPIKATSEDVDEGPITVQGDGHETNEGPEQLEAAALDNVGDEDPSVIGGEERILSEKPTRVTDGVGDEGLSTSMGGGLNVNEVPERHEEVTPKVTEVIGNEGLSTDEREGHGLSDHSGVVFLSRMTEDAWDKSLDTIRGEAAEESSGAGFELAPLEVAIDMANVSSGVTPVTIASTVTPSAEVALFPNSSLVVA
ncbi:hypothetical protein AMTR_s00006p00163730 [Amborella trichopoda]|uniref:Uncharacterized protein n=1 Tax=Amborella trichopoda TaxID=13333 RepID=W1PCK2_AMBTC|nr:hypothetical protein AMTR_s00006p00163730 [Amborella trichopoda]